MARSYRGAGVIRWGAQDGKDGVNYLIMGWWSANVHYKLTDAGIPVVKVEDTSPDKFSVYKLTALQSTLGIFVASEWEKVKSADFVYMQDAYIERLQATIVTAERIEALNIVTSNLEVKDGAKIGGFIIENDKLVSALSGQRIEIDPPSRSINMYDSKNRPIGELTFYSGENIRLSLKKYNANGTPSSIVTFSTLIGYDVVNMDTNGNYLNTISYAVNGVIQNEKLIDMSDSVANATLIKGQWYRTGNIVKVKM